MIYILYSRPSFESVGLSLQENRFKIYMQDGGHGGHLGVLIETSFATFDLKWLLYFLLSLELTGLSVQKKFKTDFQDAVYRGNLGFPIETILVF